MYKKIFISLLCLLFLVPVAFAQAAEEEKEDAAPTYLQAVINTEEAIEVSKSTIFDASLSFIPQPEREIKYEWDFGDGNKNEGIEVLHAYQDPGNYTVTLTISDGVGSSEIQTEIFLYRKLILLLTDQTTAKERIENIKDFAEKLKEANLEVEFEDELLSSEQTKKMMEK